VTWGNIALKRIATLAAGGTPSVDEPNYWSEGDDGYAWSAISDMSSVDAVTATGRRISEDGLRSARIKVGEPGTILFSMYASLGHTAWLEVPAAWNQAILGLRADQRTDARFLRYSLVAMRQGLAELARSSTQANLNAEQVGNLPISRPPLDEQRRIANFLDAEVDEVDELLYQRRLHQELLAVRITSSLVSSVLLDDRTWTRTRLKYLFSSIRNGLWGDEPIGGPEDVTCVRVADFQRDGYRADTAAPTLRSIPAAAAKGRILRRGDILLEKSGGGEQSPVGFAVMFDSDVRSVCSNFVAAMRVTESVNPRFACLLLAAYYRSGRNLPYIKQATGIQNLDGGAYLAQEVWVPALHEQTLIAQRFDHELDQTLALRSSIDRQIALLMERRQALITAAVTGQIDVTTARGVDV